jgi:transcriptional regulator with XRE-family HTH domain
VGKILKLAKERGVKQSHLNDLIGGYRGKITEWKNGKSSPTEHELKILSDFFHVPYEFFNERRFLDTGKDDIQSRSVLFTLSDSAVELPLDTMRFAKTGVHLYALHSSMPRIDLPVRKSGVLKSKKTAITSYCSPRQHNFCGVGQ